MKRQKNELKVVKLLVNLTTIMLLMTVFIQTGNAQSRGKKKVKKEETEVKWTDRLMPGGGLGLGYNNGWRISVSPQVGYRLTERFIPGIGLDYTFISFKYENDDQDKFSAVGPKAFLLYYITPELNLGTEFVYNRYKETRELNGQKQVFRDNFNSWLVGGGYTQRLGGRAGLRLELYYDALYDDDNIFLRRRGRWQPRINIVYGLN